VARAHKQLADAAAEYKDRLAECDAKLEQAHQEANAARIDAASAHAAKMAAVDDTTRERETASQLRLELESARQAAQHAIADTAAARVELARTQAEAAAARRSAEVDRETAASLGHDLERFRHDRVVNTDVLSNDGLSAFPLGCGKDRGDGFDWLSYSTRRDDVLGEFPCARHAAVRGGSALSDTGCGLAAAMSDTPDENGHAMLASSVATVGGSGAGADGAVVAAIPEAFSFGAMPAFKRAV
jgi:hypothetical protein